MDGGTWRKPRQGRLSPETRSEINRLTRLALQSPETIDPDDLDRLLRGFDNFLPSDVPMVARAIGSAFRDYSWLVANPSRVARLAAYFKGKRSTIEPVDLAWLNLFHCDGFAREAALNGIAEPPRHGFWTAALLHRLADWVPEVRNAAERCLLRLEHAIPPGVIVDALPFALEPDNASRMEIGGQTAGLHFLARDDIFDDLRHRLMSTQVGPIHRLLCRISAFSDRFDQHLGTFALNARHPAVRARALKLLLTGRAEDLSDRRPVYVKSSNTFRHEPVVTSRQLDGAADVPALIVAGAQDRAATVRKIAADGLVLHRHTLADIESVIAAFDHEKNAAVRERVDFVKRQRRTAT